MSSPGKGPGMKPIALGAAAVAAVVAAVWWFGFRTSTKSEDAAVVDMVYRSMSLEELKHLRGSLEVLLTTGKADERTRERQRAEIRDVERIIAEKESAPTG